MTPEELYRKYRETDMLHVSVISNQYVQNLQKLNDYAESRFKLKLPFQHAPENELTVFGFKISKWFEEFEFVDSLDSFKKLIHRLAKTGNKRGLESLNYHLGHLSNFKNYDWSNPLICCISDQFLIFAI